MYFKQEIITPYTILKIHFAISIQIRLIEMIYSPNMSKTRRRKRKCHTLKCYSYPCMNNYNVGTRFNKCKFYESQDRLWQ